MLMVKAIGGTQEKSKTYATIERADFSNAIVFDNLVHNWKLLNVNINMDMKTMLNVSFKFMYLLIRLLMLRTAQ